MLDRVENHLNDLRFSLRENFWGRARLRPGLPHPSENDRIRKERDFYKLVIKTLYPHETDRARIDLCWDIGCRNWSYAQALAEMFPKARLLGVEIDGTRRYWNLYRRMDLAQAYANKIQRSGRSVRCLFQDFLKVGPESIEEADRPSESRANEAWLFCFFFPFVSERPCLKWGLPARYSDFGKLLEHALKLGSSISQAQVSFLSTHQGDWELELAVKAYESQGLKPKTTFLKPSQFHGLWPSPHHVTLIQV